MAYSTFTLKKVKDEFNLTVIENINLFRDQKIQPFEISDFLKLTLKRYVPLALSVNTEKSRSEWIIAPILVELKEQLNEKISLFSGKRLDVDSALGLDGYCDYLISLNSEQYYISAPILTIIEAKKEDIIEGLGQCIATMYAAHLFNERDHQNLPRIYGAVTSGSSWKFILLEENKAFIDTEEYYLKELEKILAILVYIAEEAGQCASMDRLEG